MLNNENTDSIADDSNKTEGKGSAISLKTLGKQISLVRKMLGFSQTAFAEAIGITPQTQSLIERGLFSSNNLFSKIYFSLYEITNDSETLNLLEEYQKVNIGDLMRNLIICIRNMNCDLNLMLKSKEEVK